MIAKVAVLVSVLLAIALSACGADEVVKSPETPHSKAPLDGAVLEHRGAVAFVRVGDGIAVVNGAWEGGLAVAVPTGSVAQSWIENPTAGRLDGLAAWRDGETIHVLGHRCDVAASRDDDGDRCPAASLVSVTFSLASQEWGTSSPEIATGGVVTDLVAGTGTRALAVLSDGRPSTGLALVDVARQTTVRLPGRGAAPGGAACVSDGAFLAVTTPSDGSSVDGGSTLSSDPHLRTAAVSVQIIAGEGESVQDAEVVGADLPDDTRHVAVVGCADDGTVLQIDRVGEKPPKAYLVRSDGKGSVAVLSELPDGPFEGQPGAGYSTDLTSSVLISKQIPVAESQADRKGPWAILRPDDDWLTVESDMAEGAVAAVARDMGGYLVMPDDGGWRLRAFTT